MARAVTHQIDELHASALTMLQDAIFTARRRIYCGDDVAVIVAETGYNIDVGIGRELSRTTLATLLAAAIVELAQSERMHE